MSVSEPRLTTKTRKAHGPCTWCGEAIERGQSMVTHRDYFEDSPQTCKFHLECHAAWKRLDWRLFEEDGFGEGSFKRGTCVCREDGEDYQVREDAE